MSKITDAYTLLNERKWRKVVSQPLVRRWDAKKHKGYCQVQRNKASSSMMTAGHPTGLRPTAEHTDDRTKMLFGKYYGRVKDKQDRK